MHSEFCPWRQSIYSSLCWAPAGRVRGISFHITLYFLTDIREGGQHHGGGAEGQNASRPISADIISLSCHFSASLQSALIWRSGTLTLAINPLNKNHRLLYLKTQSVPRSKHFSSRFENQSVYAVSGTSRCLFSDKYKTHKYSVGRAYSC